MNAMVQLQNKEMFDRDVRHFIYANFSQTSRPPSTSETAAHFKVSIAAVEKAYQRLANSHHIVLAPGSYSIWMAHPFSSLPTNYITKVENKRFWGN